MKKSLSFILFSALNFFVFSQTTATNFTCDDCHGVSHDLFTELDSEKVIVIAWVMPCGGCISGALAGHTAAESFATSNPGQVLFYLVDDYGNTPCNSLGTWGNTNGMTNAVLFSNPLIKMSDYGGAGMPKVVVLGGANHTVYYNKNNSAISQAEITAAISLALAVNSVDEIKNTKEELVVYPNPGNNVVSLNIESLGISKNKEITIVLKNILGEEILVIFKGQLAANQELIQFNTAELSNGNYFIHFSGTESLVTSKIVVSH